MKNIFSLFLCLSLFISFAQDDQSYSLLWEISGNGLKEKSYLFGTMHVENNKAFNFPDEIFYALENSDGFAMELNPDEMMKEIFTELIDRKKKDSTNVFKKYLTEKEYDEFVERLKKEKDINIDEIDLSSPMSVQHLLEDNIPSEDDQETVVDAYLYGLSKTMGKSIHGLEQVKDQLDMFFRKSEEDQKKMVRSIANFDNEQYNDMLDDMLKVYNEGNIDKLYEFMQTYDDNPIDQVMIERNHVMLNSSIKLMHRKPTFIAVGAAHLPSEYGLINLLREKGYTVTKSKATFNNLIDNYKIDQSKMKWHVFKDSEFGYQALYPGEPNPMEFSEDFKIFLFLDLMTQMGYSSFAIDISKRLDYEDAESIIKRMSKSFSKGNDLISERIINRKGMKIYELVYKSKEKNESNKMHLTVKGSILYALMVVGKEKQIASDPVKRFLESLSISEPKIKLKNAPFIFEHEAGAFSIKLPKEPREMVREVPNPLDSESEPYIINMYLTTDIKKKRVNIVRYNNMPLGYYAENTEEMFGSIEESLTGKAKIISKRDITLHGYAAQELELMLNDKYHGIAQVFFRGNRTYLIMENATQEGEKVSPESEFFSSFKLLDFKETEMEELEIAFGYKIKSFDKKLSDKLDTAKDDMVFDNYVYQTLDTNSGATYSTEISEIKDFYRTEDLNSFFEDVIENSKTWNDTLISLNKVNQNGAEGRDFIIRNKATQTAWRGRVLIDDKYYIYKSVYDEEKQLYNNLANEYIESLSGSNKKTGFDIFASKTDSILIGLQSEDTTRIKKSMEAFEYYPFNSSDLKKLHDALSRSYSSDYDEDIKLYILNDLNILADSTSLEPLKIEYSNSDNAIIKSNILQNITNNKHSGSYAAYLELLDNNPPTKEDMNYWGMFTPLTDSIQFAAENIDQVIRLLDKKEYRFYMLSALNGISNNGDYDELILEKRMDIFQYANSDLEEYRRRLSSEKEDHIYCPELYYYLDIMSRVKMPAFADDFTLGIMSLKNKWAKTYVTKAFKLRISQNLDINKDLMNEFMEDMPGQRFSFMEAAFKQNRELLIPKKFKKTASFAETCFYHYMSDEGIPDEVKTIGKVTVDNNDYQVLSYSYESEDKKNVKKYMGLVGPLPKQNNVTKIERITCYTDYNELRKDWKAQANKMVPALIDYGY